MRVRPGTGLMTMADGLDRNDMKIGMPDAALGCETVGEFAHGIDWAAQN